MYNTTRNDVKQLAEKIETLAKELRDKLDSGGDIFVPANELVRNNSTLIFTLGEVWALENTGKKVLGKVVSNPNKTARNYARDSRGRFSSKP